MSEAIHNLTVGVRSIGMAAPGMPTWTDAQPVLRGETPYEYEELPRYAPSFLPPNERRRATPVGRLAFQSAEEAIKDMNGEASGLASVFASSGGDTDIVNKICSALATEDRLVSPTHFHNSVHNAAAGYWSIATGSHGASTSLSAFDWSFACGLLEAVTLACCENVDVLLVSYDVQVADPLYTKRPIDQPFTSAMVLTADLGRADKRLSVSTEGNGGVTSMDEPALEVLRNNNPAARALPLLQALAGGTSARVTLPAPEGLNVTVDVQNS